MYAFDFIKKQGIPSAEKYPYTSHMHRCKYDEEEDKEFQIADFKVYEHILNYDLEKLACHHAVAVPVFINDCFKHYKSGILTNEECKCNKGRGATNHAVTIVGFGKQYDKDAKCAKYWLVKNSWGNQWGEDGFIRICKEDEDTDFGTCSIRKSAIIPIGMTEDIAEEQLDFAME